MPAPLRGRGARERSSAALHLRGERGRRSVRRRSRAVRVALVAALDARTEAVVAFDQAGLRLPAALIARELAVARLACEGHSNAEIAGMRGTSVRTVANQLAAIYGKLGVGSRVELIAALES